MLIQSEGVTQFFIKGRSQPIKIHGSEGNENLPVKKQRYYYEPALIAFRNENSDDDIVHTVTEDKGKFQISIPILLWDGQLQEQAYEALTEYHEGEEVNRNHIQLMPFTKITVSVTGLPRGVSHLPKKIRGKKSKLVFIADSQNAVDEFLARLEDIEISYEVECGSSSTEAPAANIINGKRKRDNSYVYETTLAETVAEDEEEEEDE